jgi:hypothetical protein
MSILDGRFDGQTLDVTQTKFRKGKLTKRGVIDYCPKCGKKADKVERFYGTEYVHEWKATYVGIGYVPEVGDSCIIPKEKQP